MKNLPKKINYSQARARAAKMFQLKIRLSDTDENGYGKCCTCGKWVSYNHADAGHWISRSVEATLFDEKNCALQCKICNGKRNLHNVYRTFLIEKYGEGEVMLLEQRARLICHRKVHDYLWIEKEQKQQIAELMKTKNFVL